MLIVTNSFTGEDQQAIPERRIAGLTVSGLKVYAIVDDYDQPIAGYVTEKQADKHFLRLSRALANPLRRLFPYYKMPEP